MPIPVVNNLSEEELEALTRAIRFRFDELHRTRMVAHHAQHLGKYYKLDDGDWISVYKINTEIGAGGRLLATEIVLSPDSISIKKNSRIHISSNTNFTQLSIEEYNRYVKRAKDSFYYVR